MNTYHNLFYQPILCLNMELIVESLARQWIHILWISRSDLPTQSVHSIWQAIYWERGWDQFCCIYMFIRQMLVHKDAVTSKGELQLQCRNVAYFWLILCILACSPWPGSHWEQRLSLAISVCGDSVQVFITHHWVIVHLSLVVSVVAWLVLTPCSSAVNCNILHPFF